MGLKEDNWREGSPSFHWTQQDGLLLWERQGPQMTGPGAHIVNSPNSSSPGGKPEPPGVIW